MARVKKPTQLPVEQPAINEQEINEVMNAMTAIQSEYSDERDLVNQIIGEQRMAEALGKFSLTVSTFKLKIIKENKLYKSLSGKKTADGQQFSGTWEDFCQLIGKSRPQVDEDILNLNIFGEEALDGMSQIGIGYRELRQYRKLPEDQKTALIEVAKAGDKEALVELAEEFIAKNAKEKETLQKENAELKKEYKALDAVNATDRKSIDDLKLKLSKYELKLISIDEQITDLSSKIDLSKNIYKPIKSALSELTTGIEHLYQLKLNMMENTPDFQPGDEIKLPDVMLDELLSYDGLIILMLDNIRTIHKDFCQKFDVNIEELKVRMDETAYENLNTNEVEDE